MYVTERVRKKFERVQELPDSIQKKCVRRRLLRLKDRVDKNKCNKLCKEKDKNKSGRKTNRNIKKSTNIQKNKKREKLMYVSR